MQRDPLLTLQVLEDEYAGQPLVVQHEDLRTINHLRSQLGMPLVDARLCVIGTAVQVAEPEPQPEVAPDHTEARTIYRAYLRKKDELDVHRAYAERVVKATGGLGQTPVRPLATMGTNGGPLLCDHCGKPILLEGGPFHGVAVDVAWQQNPTEGWKSWILGGMVVEILINGTLRIYHGYPGRNDTHCCNVASRNEETAQAQFKSRKNTGTFHLLLAFVEKEFPDMTARGHLDLVNEILNTMYEYDPGTGINRPTAEG